MAWQHIDEEVDDRVVVNDETVVVEKKRDWSGVWMSQYDGIWYPLMILQSMLNFQKNYKAFDTDIILSTMPKSGTTWLKALTYSIVNRHRYPINDVNNPLLTSNPHALVPYLEVNVYRDQENPNLKKFPSPRIFSTHSHYRMLPDTIKQSSGCRVIYICRNPLDQFVSLWHFKSSMDSTREISQEKKLEEAMDMYCQGNHLYGPLWEHMLDYWNAHLKNPEKVLFLKYEDLKRDIASNVKKIAEFIGYPFSFMEEKQGLIGKICELCSFDNLKNLEINKEGANDFGVKYSSYFRKGEIGDWVNLLTPSMAERLEKVSEMKLKGSGLTFNN